MAWDLPSERGNVPALKSAPEKLRIAEVMKRTTSVSNPWIAQRLEMGGATSVGPLLHRFRQSRAAGHNEFSTVLSRFST